MEYKQLTREQRYHIYGLWQAGYTLTGIAKEVGVHKSTISREFKRNVFWYNSRIPQYKPDYAQQYCQQRHKSKPKRTRFTKMIAVFLEEKLLLDWSPEQISGYAKRHNLFSISHERIYQFILKNKEAGGNLYTHLRHLLA
ncbi:MAG: helix-turn-helix domain-containing protein [Gammaproteobacteria bacterium]|nr:helix-turn-helix domain-containing protein [Gammaproteobacteria bacterium]